MSELALLVLGCAWNYDLYFTNHSRD